MDVTVAVFDVDGTLTVRDCVVPFTRRVAGTPRLLVGAAKNFLPCLRALIARDRDAVKALFVEIAFSGKEVVEVENSGVSFADEVFHRWMRKDVAARFRWHQSQDHVVVLVSASLEPYLLALGDLLEADAVLCTRLENRDGYYTGKIDGANCRGEEKVTRLLHWCQQAGISPSNIEYAYGDSAGDAEMLTLAHHQFFVRDTEIDEVPA